MSLNKQMVLFIVSLLLILLVGTFSLNLSNTKHFLQDQLHSHAQDTATSLGLSLSTLTDPNDISSMETMINAVFDRGYYSNITLKDVEGKILYQKTNAKKMDAVPSFFINAIQLSTPTAEALVQSGWMPIGTLSVTSHAGYAYIELWKSTTTLLTWFLISAIIAILIIIIVLKMMLKPLKKMEAQACAIVQKEYLIQDELPKTTEFQEVVCAMNTMVTKLKTVFERDAITVEKLQKIAYQDTVTGLHNRRHFEMMIDSLLDPKNECVAGTVFLLQIQNLKNINEKYGYIMGNKVMRALADTMQAHLRHNNSLFARLNGTELIAVLPNSQAEQIGPQAEQIVQSLPNILKELSAEEAQSSLSAAYLHYEPEQSRTALLANLDFAINQASQQGQNQVFFYKTDTKNQAQNLSWDKMLNQAFFEERFILFQQSSYDKNREIYDQEVLIRLTDVKGTIRTAGYFMPAVEQLNRIEEIDKLVIQLSIQYLSMQVANHSIAINLSKSVLENVMFKKWLLKTLKASSEITSSISFEMPERLVSEEKGVSWPLINELKQLGVGFGIDHFGCRLSNVNYLQDLRPEYIKLDPSFSKAITSDEQTQNYVSSLCELADSLDIKVIAMAIENEVQQKEFASLGVKYFQGYYYGAPSALIARKSL